MAIAVDKTSIGSAVSESAGTSIVLTTSQAVVSGGFILLFVGWVIGDDTAIDNVAGGGLTWTIDRQGRHGGGSQHSAIVSAQAPSGLASATDITVTFTASVSLWKGVAGSSFTGIAAASPVDTSQPVNAQGSGAGWTTSNVTTTNANDLLFGTSFAELTGGTSDPGSNNELFDANPGSGFNHYTTVYLVVSSTGTYALAGTYSASADAKGSTIVAYKASGAAPQEVRPDADTTTTGWTTTPLFSKINDESDSTVITATAS